ncbi:MAG: formamidopyrimidine-DNA glycosylase [Actinobacteria bacterium RBG_16_64_13]|nr:MAG: formamidopyrimidine-DNA glycosylase [Actinobacteria bacterium RBG_16_64_13]
MPEIPDIEAYIEALRLRVLGEPLLGTRLSSPFLLRTVEPPLAAVAGGRVAGVERLGKRIVFEVVPVEAGARTGGAGEPETSEPSRPEDPYCLALHLMIAGRLHWKAAGAGIPKGSGLVAFDFPSGSLILTEAGKKRRASLHLVRGSAALHALDPGGIEILASSLEEFAAALRRENHTLKRALTDPRILSGIGNAYSDEILHRACLSPLKLSYALDSAELGRLYKAAREVLQEWTERLRAEARERFPEKVTAFRSEMAVHGRFGASCPVCGSAVERIVYSDNECDYCPGCQTGGRILADRSLSRLLKDDWPRSMEERTRPPRADDLPDPL